MDPGSASVAFIGLAASLVTLTALCAESCQRLWTLNHNLRNTPEELKRLSSSVDLLKTLLEGFRDEVQNGNEDTFPSQLVGVWTQSVRQMDQDLQKFDALVASIFGKSNCITSKRIGLRVRIKNVIAEGKIADWEQTLRGHIHLFTLYHSMMISTRLEKWTRSKLLCPKSSTFTDDQHLSLHSSAQEARPNFQQTSREGPRSASPWLSVEMPQIRAHNVEHNLSTPKPQSKIKFSGTPETAEFSRLLVMNYNSFSLPVGVVSFEKRGRVVIRDTEETNEQVWTFIFVPKPWLAARYNHKPSLQRYVFWCNKSGLQRLFKQREATPNDFLVAFGRPLLQEAIFAHYMNIAGSLDMVSFLLSEGADPNCRDANFYTPLLLCCKLVFNTSRGPKFQPCFRHMFPLIKLLLSAGADPTLCGGPLKLSTFSSYFYEGGPLDHIRDIFRQYVDAANFDDLLQFDGWILACLLRNNSKFRKDLESELAEFRTVPRLSTTRRSNLQILEERISVTNQVHQLKQADPDERIRFLRSLCRVGTADMIAPFFSTGISINEADDTQLSYLGEAVSRGNLGAVTVLLDSGARVEAGSFMDSVGALLARWSAYEGMSLAKKELHLMEELVKVSRIPTEAMPTALLNSMRLDDDNACFKMLLERGFGLSTLPAGHRGRNRSIWGIRQHPSNAQGGGAWFETIEAVYRNNLSALRALVDRGATVEDEDDAGCTALVAAIDLGRVEFVSELVCKAHAQLDVRAGCGFTPLDLCCRNLLQSHPRPIIFNHRIIITDRISVSMEQDQQIYSIIQRGRKEKGRIDRKPRSNNGGLWRRGFPELSSFRFARGDGSLRQFDYARAELVFQYTTMNRFLKSLSPSNILLGIFGFLVTVLVLGCYAAWEGGWRLRGKFRRSSRALQVITMVLLATAVVLTRNVLLR